MEITNININTDELRWRVMIVLVFALLFTLLSILVPYAYYFLTPTSTFFEVQQFTVGDVSDDDSRLQTHLIRDARSTYMGTFYIEVNRVTSESRERVYYEEHSTVVEKGTHESIWTLDNEPLSAGDYQVVASGYVTVEHGVKKYISWSSNTFQVTQAEAEAAANETAQNQTPTNSAFRHLSVTQEASNPPNLGVSSLLSAV